LVARTRVAMPFKTQSELAQTINYEEDKAPNLEEEGLEKPVYESSEGPIPKDKRKGRY